MKTVLLMRHAKSDWKDENLADLERPLNQRGQRAAPLMGTLLREKGWAPQRILCSSAVRARQTTELLAATAEYPGEFFTSTVSTWPSPRRSSALFLPSPMIWNGSW